MKLIVFCMRPQQELKLIRSSTPFTIKQERKNAWNTENVLSLHGRARMCIIKTCTCLYAWVYHNPLLVMNDWVKMRSDCFPPPQNTKAVFMPLPWIFGAHVNTWIVIIYQKAADKLKCEPTPLTVVINPIRRIDLDIFAWAMPQVCFAVVVVVSGMLLIAGRTKCEWKFDAGQVITCFIHLPSENVMLFGFLSNLFARPLLFKLRFKYDFEIRLDLIDAILNNLSIQ